MIQLTRDIPTLESETVATFADKTAVIAAGKDFIQFTVN